MLLPALAGCTHSAAPVDPKLATRDYWLDQPAAVHVSNVDFYKLWNACREEAHSRFFLIDRQDYRLGVLSTLPLISKQAFEVWRRDVVTPGDIAASTLATLRRSIWFQISRQSDGSFVAEPKVVVERYATAERRLTAIYEYHVAFSGPRTIGDVQSDQGVTLPTDYWYSTGRDTALEKDLAMAIRGRLK